MNSSRRIFNSALLASAVAAAVSTATVVSATHAVAGDKEKCFGVALKGQMIAPPEPEQLAPEHLP